MNPLSGAVSRVTDTLRSEMAMLLFPTLIPALFVLLVVRGAPAGPAELPYRTLTDFTDVCKELESARYCSCLAKRFADGMRPVEFRTNDMAFLAGTSDVTEMSEVARSCRRAERERERARQDDRDKERRLERNPDRDRDDGRRRRGGGAGAP